MFLEKYRVKFEQALFLAIERMGEKNALRDACEYALVCGGKRLRPLIVMGISDALGFGLDVMEAAVSVEFFHTASLIADDLPCMDNDDVRRSRPSLHKAVGEGLAVLASYTLIAEGYGGIYRNGAQMGRDERFVERADKVALTCLKAATSCAGMNGATNGQFLDLFPPDGSWDTFCKVVAQKTTTLFEVSFLFGWLFGGGDEALIGTLKKCAHHLGMAFQVADDLDDDEQDAGKMNVVKILGREGATALFQREVASFKKCLEGLGLWTAPFQELYGRLSRSLSCELLGQSRS